jgi:hypothetical protein
MESQILKKVMLQAVDEGNVCLPIYDAVAVLQRHQASAEQAISTPGLMLLVVM